MSTSAKLIKPMKAPSKSVTELIPGGDLGRLSYPLYASYKFDGVRAIIQNGVVYSNNLKPIPNKHVQELFGRKELDGFDGELIVGEATAPDVFRRTMSGVMARDGEPEVRFFIFDDVSEDMTACSYETRFECMEDWHQGAGRNTFPLVVVVQQVIIHNSKALLDLEEKALKLGYEGLMLRDPDALYKEGPNRATLRSGELLKLKRFADSEAIVLEVLEAETNTNEATVDELGRTKRSSHKAGKVGKGMLGAIRAKDVHTGQEVIVGPGTLTKDQREEWWRERENKKGTLFVYKFFPSGSKDLPRFPTFKGTRHLIDLSKKGK